MSESLATQSSARPVRMEVCDVGPRDGLQGLARFIPTARKIRLIEDLVDAGLRSIEVASFVSASAIPQMRDGAEVLGGLRRRPEVTLAAFIPNLRGLEDAARLHVDRVTIATYASEEFSKRNVNATVAEANERMRAIARAAEQGGIAARGYVSCAIDCPFTGPVAPARVAELAEQVLDAGCAEVFLADTTGRGTTASVSRLVDGVLERVPAARLGVHFHDTFGQGLANVATCIERGIRRIDASVAGLGGCPTARGAAGNVATEDVLLLLEGLGIDTGIDVARVAAIGAELCDDLGIRNDSKAGRALASRADESRRVV